MSGNRCSDIYNAASEAVGKAGFEEFRRWCLEHAAAIGHSIGLDIHEQPGLTPYDETRLEPGMVFSLEPFINKGAMIPWSKADEKYGLEDVVLVTEDGPENLTGEDLIKHGLWTA